MTSEEHDILLDALLDHISLGIAVKDADHDFRFVLCNKAFAETVGRSVDSIIGKTDAELDFRVFNAKTCRRHDRRVMRTKKPFEVIEQTDGSFDARKVFRVLKFPLQLPNGQCLVVGTFMDITRLQNLIDSEQKMSAILAKSVVESDVGACFSMIAETLFEQLACASVALIDCSVLGHYSLRFERLNPEVRSFSLLTPAQLHAVFAQCAPRFAKGHQKLIIDTTSQRFFDVWQTLGMRSVLLTPIRLECHVWGILVAGFHRPRASFTAIDRRIMMSMANIFALQMMRSRQNEALRKAQRLEAVGVMSSWVAHDFNNMVQSILGHTDLALQEVPAGSPIREDLELIYQAAEQSTGIVHQLLTFARQDKVCPILLDVNACIRDLSRLLSKLVCDTADLRVTLAEQACWISMDVAQMTQVLTNLVANARDAVRSSKRHGVIDVTTAVVPVDDPFLLNSAAAGNYVRLTVADNGCGMSEHVRQRMFEPFFTTKTGGNGTGLGLSAVHGILTQNNGLVAVESVENEGTTFALYFPCCTQ